jgi:hypothetical protein
MKEADMPKRKWLIAAGALVTLCLCLSIGGVLILDPFQWRLTDLLFGRADPLVRAIPEDASLVVSLDLKNLGSSDGIRVYNAVAGTSGAEEISSLDDLVRREIDPWLQGQFNLAFEADFKPWLGEYIDLAVFGLGSGDQAALQEGFPSQLLLLVDIRNRGKADAFIEKCRNSEEQDMNASWSDSTYKGATIHEIRTQDISANAYYLARSGNILMVSGDLDSIQKAIDAQTGGKGSLAGAQWYKKLSSHLPGTRAVSLFFEKDAMQSLSGMSAPVAYGMDATSLVQNSAQDAVEGEALSLSAVKQGLRLDSIAAYDESKLTAEQRTMIFSGGLTNDTKRLPDTTLAFVGGQHLDLGWKNARQSVSQLIAGGDLDQLMRMFEEQYGFNPDSDLFPYLSGDWSIALVPDSESSFAQPQGEDLGFVMSMDASDEQALGRTVGKFNAAMEAQGGGAVGSRTVAGLDAFTLGADSGNVPVAVYGVGQGHLTIASSVHLFEDVNDGGPSIASSKRYKSAWAGMPSGFAAVLYADLRGIAEQVRDPSVKDYFDTGLKPVQSIVLGTRNLGNGVTAAVLLVAIGK